MKICFISNYFNHHQRPFCEALFSELNTNFVFIATTVMSQERIKLGYGLSEVPTYVKDYQKDPETKRICDEYLRTADVIIIGSASPELIKEQIQNGTIVYRYSERLAKTVLDSLKFPMWHFKWKKYYSYQNVHLLCASAFAYRDFYRMGFFKNRAYKWGYFPETRAYDLNLLQTQKRRNKILWCGRLIDWKHADDAICVAKRLKDEGYIFELDMIGNGVMTEQLNELVSMYDLSSCVNLLGSMTPEQVRTYMEQSGIYLFTSDRQEGWGAVLNEAMNSGCAVVASHAIGSVPFLVDDGENGLIYQSGNVDMLFEKVKYLLDAPEKQVDIGCKAYQTISGLWNAKLATGRFLQLTEKLLSGEEQYSFFETGPCSKARILKENWFRNLIQ
jgi:glycosyltransferase involved in cell wall biosynthesis